METAADPDMYVCCPKCAHVVTTKNLHDRCENCNERWPYHFDTLDEAEGLSQDILDADPLNHLRYSPRENLRARDLVA